MFYFHGFPGSQVECDLLQPERELPGVDVRLIALDHPGFGSSTFQPGRRTLDWATDVDEAADLLGLDRFAVLGVSGGGPCALACGHALNGRVTRIGVAAGIAPPEAPGMDKAAIAKISRRYLVRRIQCASGCAATEFLAFTDAAGAIGSAALVQAGSVFVPCPASTSWRSWPCQL